MANDRGGSTGRGPVPGALARAEFENETATLPHAAQLRRGFRWLRFEPGLEAEFRSQYWERFMLRTRFALAGGAILFALFALKDLRTLPGGVGEVTAGFRLLLIVPAILFGLAFSFIVPWRRWFEAVLLAGSLVALGGLAALILVASSMGASIPDSGLMLVMVFVMFLTGLRFHKAAIAVVGCVTAFLIGCVALHAPIEQVRLSAYYLYGVALIGLIGAYSLEYALRANFLTEAVAQFRALRDPLTLLYNRRAAMDHLHRAWRIAFRERVPLAILLIDVDHFKRYNDRYGHLNGDGCLTEVALTLGDRIRRPLDVIARYGGEEFLAVLYDVSPRTMDMICEDIRRAVVDLAIPHAGNTLDGRVTVSIGAAWVEPHAGDKTVDAVLEAADNALYRAKMMGRNRVAIAEDPPGGGAPVPAA